MAEPLINLEPTASTNNPIDLTPQAVIGPKPPSPEVAQQRATKASMGIPHLFPQPEPVEQQILQGNEAAARERAASFVSQEQDLKRQRVVTAFMAAKGGQPLDDKEKEAVGNYLIRDRAIELNALDPKTIFEEQYAKAFTNNVKTQNENNTDSIWNRMSPEEAEHWVRNGSSTMAQQEFLNTMLDEANTELKNQGWPGWVWDRAKEWLIPGMWQLKLRGHLPYGLLGTDLQNDANNLFSLGWNNNFKAAVSERTQNFNPGMKAEWLAAMMGLSSSERGMYNLLTFGDLVGKPIGAGLAGKLIKGAAGSVIGRSALTTALEARLREPASPAATMEAAGKLKEAAALDVSKQLIDKEAGKGNAVYEILKNLPGRFNGAIDFLHNNPGRWRREEIERIIQRNQQAGDLVTEAALKTIKVDRIPPLQAMNKAVAEFQDMLRNDYRDIENTILNDKFRYDDITNSHNYELYLGPNGDSLWSSEAQANKWGKANLKGLQWEPVEQGGSWGITVSKPVPLSDYARDILLSIEGAKTPQGWLNSVIGRFITPEETLSQLQKQARKTVAYGVSTNNKLAKNLLGEEADLKKWSSIPFTKARQKWLDFRRVLKSAEKDIDPRTNRLGRRYETPDELDQAYQKALGPGRLPDEQELHAYFAWKRGEELKDTWRDLNAYRTKKQEGAQTLTITLGDPKKETAKSIGIKKVTLDATLLPEYPKGKEGIVVLGNTLGDERIAASDLFGKRNEGKLLKEEIKKGETQVYQLSEYLQQPLKDLFPQTKDGFPKYIAIPKGQVEKVEDVQWKQYPRRPPEYSYAHSVKQGIIRKDSITGKYLYLGDKTISVHNIRAMSANVAKSLNEIRLALKNKDIEGAKAIHAASGLPQEFSEIHGWFKGSSVRGAGGRFEKQAARLSLDDPIVSMPRGKVTASTGEAKTRLGKAYDDVSYQGPARYIGEKYDPEDVFTLRNEGTAQNPLYRIAEPEYLDPLTSQSRSINRLSVAQFMNDYKAFSMNHFLEEAAPYLTVSKQALRAAPEFFFHNISTGRENTFWKNVTGDDVYKVRNLKTALLQTKQFAGLGDETSNWLHAAAQHLSDSMYEGKFPGGVKAALATEHLLPKIRDPYQYLRSMTFHAKLGMFNISQLWVQAQTFATTWAIAGPKFAAPGTKAALLYSWSRYNRHPEIMAKLDQLASTKIIPGTANWKPGWFTEGTDFLENSGFLNIANEHAFRDAPWRHNIVSANGQIFLDAGTWFFRTGEKSSRVVAGYTAFLEFREAHPTGAISNLQKQAILDRADLLYANMSRASVSTIQHGIFSIPTQFLSYQMRMAELAFGRRLTTAERMRLYGTYAAIYGVPGALGLTGLPLGDWVRKDALQNGYNPGEDYIRTAFHEGLPSMIIALATGAVTGKEEYFNIQERYGINGFDPIREFLRSDKTFWDIFAGATGNTLVNGIRGSHGFWKAMYDLIKGEGRYPLKMADLVEPFREVSSFNNILKLITATNIAQTVSKSDRIMEDTTSAKAIFSYLSGLQPQSITDNYLQGTIKKDEENYSKYFLDKFSHEIRRGILAVKDGNYSQADDYFRRARAWLIDSGYPPHQYSSAYAQAMKGYQPMVDRGKWDFAYGRRVPAGQFGRRLEKTQ